jgi:choline dehydrogenase-like flavoprotein
MTTRKYQFLIIGSGAGGATLARELAKKGKDVLVIERGQKHNDFGTAKTARQFYDLNSFTKMPPVTKDGVILWRAFLGGGTSVVSAGNGIRCLQHELADLGVLLEDEFTEAEAEMRISPLDNQLISNGSKKLMEASAKLGYATEPMPKFIDPTKCKACSKCTWGCRHDAKWSPLKYLDEAKQGGADILYDTTVRKVLKKNGNVTGVSGVGPDGPIEILADVTILAAGGIGTPIILRQSGIHKAGKSLFVDSFVNVYGSTDGLNQLHEPIMAFIIRDFLKRKGFILSPCVGPAGTGPLTDSGAKGLKFEGNSTIGMMVKIADESSGCVHSNGTVEKSLTDRDKARLQEGTKIATDILIEAGAKPESIILSKPQGAHPGGTAAVGELVDNNLRTDLNNLYVCDASVFPTAPGLPPILTIVALAKRLAKTLT